MKSKSAALRSMRRLLRARGGNVAMIWALSAAAIIGLIGLSVDFSRAQALRSEMQNAVDGAALVAQRSTGLSDSARSAAARAYFDQSLGSQPHTSGLEFAITPLTPAGYRATASLSLETGLSRALNLITGTDHNTLRVAVSAEATSQVAPPIELVMSLDNTGSMSHDMDALRDAAADLANSLYDLAVDPDDIKIGVVPFVAQVNIGNGATQMAWMDTTGVAPYNGAIFEGRQIGYKSVSTSNCNALNVAATQVPWTGYNSTTYRINWVFNGASGSSRRCLAYTPNSGINYFDLFTAISTEWKGCVEARPEPYDITDDPPSSATPETLFVPYFWLDGQDNNYLPDNATNSSWVANGAPSITSTTSVVMSYAQSTSNNDDKARSNVFNVFRYSQNPSPAIDTTAPSTTGPNMGCPTPITPLTNTANRSTVINAINAMDDWNGGGTDQVEGLVWGWRVLSPGAPFTQGRPYHDPADPVRKVLVLMTDGENTNINATNGFFSNPTVLGSDYAGYNYLGMWTSNITRPPSGSPAHGFGSGVTVNGTTYGALPAAYQRNITGTDSYVTYINTREGLLCTTIKNAGIEVYTVVFREPSQTIRDMLRDCATDPQHAFTADSQAELASAFTAIGQGVGKLRLTR